VSDQEAARKFGSVIGIYEGLRPVLQVTEPRLLKKILIEDFWNFCNHRVFYHEDQVGGKSLVNLENQKWKRMRQILSPVFSSAKLKSMRESYDDCIKNFLENMSLLTNNTEKAAVIDVKDYFIGFSVDVLCQVCYGIKINSIQNPNNEVVTQIQSVFGHSISLKSIIVLAFPCLMKLFDLYLLNYKSLIYLQTLTKSIITERKSQPVKSQRKDFVRLLMEASSEDGESLSEAEIFDQIILFFVAGNDTSSSSLSHVVYCLAMYPAIQERLYKEIMEFQKSNKNYLEEMNSLKYLDVVVKESLRFLPTVPRMERRTSKDCYLEGIFMPKDTMIIVPIYTLCHDERYFENPQVFNPDRFLSENINNDLEEILNQVFLPFASGPRSCIGQRFVTILTKACLIHTLPKFRFETCSETPMPLEFNCGHPVSTAKSVTLRVVRR